MTMFVRKSTLEEAVENAVRRVVAARETAVARDLEKFRDIGNLNAEVARLREHIETLKIEKGRKEEEFARKEREIEHKVGLERERQKFEGEQAKREAKVEIREENLTADRERFEEQMEFHRERLEGEVESLRKLTESLLNRLPSAEIIANYGKGD